MIISAAEIGGMHFGAETGAGGVVTNGPNPGRPGTVQLRAQSWKNINVSKIKKPVDLLSFFPPFFLSQLHLSHLWWSFIGLLHPLSKII